MEYLFFNLFNRYWSRAQNILLQSTAGWKFSTKILIGSFGFNSIFLSVKRLKYINMSRKEVTTTSDIRVEHGKMKWDPETLEIRTKSVEKTLEPLVLQVSVFILITTWFLLELYVKVVWRKKRTHFILLKRKSSYEQ